MIHVQIEDFVRQEAAKRSFIHRQLKKNPIAILLDMVDSWMDGVAEAYKIFQIFICWHWYAISVLLLPGNCHPKMTWDDHCPSSWSAPPPRRWQPMSVTVLKPKHKLWPCLSWHDSFLYLWLFYSGGFVKKIQIIKLRNYVLSKPRIQNFKDIVVKI